jgi:two-component system nitrogen regulation response regulator GlnG
VLDESAIERLQSWRWPGNVRELENLIRRIVALYPQETIGSDLIDAELAEPLANEALVEKPAVEEPLTDAVSRHILRYLVAGREGMPLNDLYSRVITEVERPLIQMTLAETRGNQIKAASMLGLNRNTLRKKIRELEIPVVRGVV